MEPASELSKWSRQMYFMLKKCFILQGRYWKSTVTQVFVGPLIMVLLLFGIQSAFNNLFRAPVVNPPAVPLKPFPKCRPAFRSPLPCITLMYSEGNAPVATVNNVMEQFRTLTALKDDSSKWTPSVDTLPSENLDVVKVSTEAFIYDFADKNPNVTAWGVSFNDVGGKLSYQIWYNYTNVARKYRVNGAPAFVVQYTEPFNDDIVALMRDIDLSILRARSGNDASLTVSTKDFPELAEGALACPRNPEQIFKRLGPVFLFIPMTFIFFSSISSISNEKEKMLKDAMEMIGLTPVIFWLSHYISIAVLVVGNALSTCVLGVIVGFSLFRKTDFGLIFFTYIMYGMATLSFALFLASVSPKVKTGVGVGFFFVIIGCIFIAFGFIATYAWYTDTSDPTAIDLNPVHYVLMFFPFFNYNKIITDFVGYTAVSTSRNGPLCTLKEGENFYWSNLYDPPRVESNIVVSASSNTANLIPKPYGSLWLFFMNVMFWGLLAIYVDRIIPNDNGQSEHPLFFLFPSTYGFKNPKWLQSSNRAAYVPESSKPLSNEDPDVTEERKEANSYDDQKEDPSGMRIRGLHKRYDSGLTFFRSWLYNTFGIFDPSKSAMAQTSATAVGNSKVAIHEVSLVVNRGDMLALLGSNGAGKTSTMKIMYGVSPMTAGKASIFGLDVRTQMKEIQKNLGVCPQFDLLYPDLSAKEHIELFCGIKGISEQEMATVMEERLKQMRLWNVRNQRSSQYSGGMKRRLSVILSTLGDPKCVFLDEPTTGMDPVNKRYVWSFLEKFKKDRVIILTTHSMEEADILADKIAIMAKGRLRAVGKSLRLKNKFGSGYRISMIIPQSEKVAEVKASVGKVCAEAVLEDEEYIGSTLVPSDEVRVDKAKVEISDKDRAGQTCRLVYALTDMESVKKLVSYLEESVQTETNTGAIASFGMSQTTLEDVFLRVLKDATI